MADGRQHPTRRFGRIGVERVVLRLHGPTDPGVRPAREALGDDTAHAGACGSREQVVGSSVLRRDLRELVGEVAKVAHVRESRGLVDDHLWPRRRDRGFHGLAVEDVEDDRLGAEPTEIVDLAMERVEA